MNDKLPTESKNHQIIYSDDEYADRIHKLETLLDKINAEEVVLHRMTETMFSKVEARQKYQGWLMFSLIILTEIGGFAFIGNVFDKVKTTQAEMAETKEQVQLVKDNQNAFTNQVDAQVEKVIEAKVVEVEKVKEKVEREVEKVEKVQSQVEAKVDRVEAKVQEQLEKVEEDVENVEAKVQEKVDRFEAQVQKKVDWVEAKVQEEVYRVEAEVQKKVEKLEEIDEMIQQQTKNN